MKNIPAKVLLSWLLCAGCVLLAGILRLANDYLGFVSRLIFGLGVVAVTFETFRWGRREGYVISGQSLEVRVEHGLRCLVMTLIGVMGAGFVGSVLLQIVYEVFWR